MEKFFTIICLTDSIDIKFNSIGEIVINLFYKLNNDPKLKQYKLDTFIHLEQGQSISFINQLGTYHFDLNNRLTFSSKGKGKIQISGSLSALNDCPQFNKLFANCLNLVSIENLEFDFDTIEPFGCYRMFYNCRYLNKCFKELPVNKLVDSCYKEMFAQCYNLQTIPNILATELADSCCTNMFDSCYELKNLNDKILPAISLAQSCYRAMFINCKNLVSAPRLAFSTVAPFSCMQMFANCPKLEVAPALLSQYLEEKCYDYMFEGCKSLRRIRVFFEQWPDKGITNWMKDVSNKGTFVKIKKLDDSLNDQDHIPIGWEIKISNCTREQVQSLLLKQ